MALTTCQAPSWRKKTTCPTQTRPSNDAANSPPCRVKNRTFENWNIYVSQLTVRVTLNYELVCWCVMYVMFPQFPYKLKMIITTVFLPTNECEVKQCFQLSLKATHGNRSGPRQTKLRNIWDGEGPRGGITAWETQPSAEQHRKGGNIVLSWKNYLTVWNLS